MSYNHSQSSTHFESVNRYNYQRSPASSPKPSSPFPSPSASASSSYSVDHQTSSPRGSSTSNQTKRKQVKNACVNCQKACKKCDDQRPCSRCIKYGIEDGCINSQRKERKKKSNSDEDKVTSSRRLNNFSPITRSSSPKSLSLRLPTRNAAIRPFPKELLKSLQESETFVDDDESDIEADEDHEEDHGNNFNCNAKPTSLISPQITEEFKTLARICSELHTILAQPQFNRNNHISPQNYPQSFIQAPQVYPPNSAPFIYHHRFQQHQNQQFNPFYPSFLSQNCFALQQQNQHQQQHFHLPRLNSTPSIQGRSVSPPQMLLRPNSLIYNMNNVTFSSQQPQSSSTLIERDMLNRTPPEDEETSKLSKLQDFN